jgi:hypothetical protein
METFDRDIAWAADVLHEVEEKIREHGSDPLGLKNSILREMGELARVRDRFRRINEHARRAQAADRA